MIAPAIPTVTQSPILYGQNLSSAYLKRTRPGLFAFIPIPNSPMGAAYHSSQHPPSQIRYPPYQHLQKKNVHKNANKFDGVPWEVRTIPGRGKGLFATETLHRGDKILADTPMGVYLSDALEQDYKLDYIYLHTAFLQLPEASQDIFLNAMTREGDPIMERVNINAFAGEFEGAQHFLLYPETAVSSIC